MSSTFAQLGVPDYICQALERDGIHTPFPIQAVTIPDALEGADICGRAPTGSGKTLAFGIPLVANAERAKSRRPRALVLSPTRELASQIAAELRTLSGRVRIGTIYGGVGYGPQKKQLQQGIEILVACPGRLEDLIDQRAVSLHEVDQVVIDEADRMADMGFLPAVRRLLDQTSSNRQTLMFSATLDNDVAKPHSRLSTSPGHPPGWRRQARHQNVRSPILEGQQSREGRRLCRPDHRRRIHDRVLSDPAWIGPAGPPTRPAGSQSRSDTRRPRPEPTHPHARGFIDGHFEALIATDVAARGIHVEGVATVIHYDPPENGKAYLHRSGRTARAGQSGLVVSLIQPDQVAGAKRIQRQLDLKGSIINPGRFDTVPAAPPHSQTESRNGRTPQGQPKSGRRQTGSPRVNRNSQRALRSGPQQRNRSRSRSGAYSR